MKEFLDIILSMPTAAWTVILGVCLGFWVLSIIGGIGVDTVDGWMDADAGDLVDGSEGGMGMLLGKMGLGGVPFMVMLTVLSLTGWVSSFYAQSLLMPLVPEGAHWLINAAVIVFSLALTFVIAVFLTALALRPLRRWLVKVAPPDLRAEDWVGRVASVSSMVLNNGEGRVEIDGGPSGPIILQARAREGHEYVRGDVVILVKHDPERHLYEVVSEKDFNAR